ncbi:hypothetical protein A9Q84_05435 [Halobacteriovorax marinus]|uniref:NAD-dependent epimerase/dehydratase domain-containing protein n=1 Tax=Halobacteriovorax marinus TaxID=97084 RepID=A0A1Y5FB70_9BACT|nr:hypothetical protein A9Q84_05435 [Halobacteriovorax marinus]
MENLKVLITGGTGFVGKNTVKKLTNDNFQVRYTTRGTILENGKPVKIGDISDQDYWREAIAGSNVVVHCLARVHILKESSTSPYDEFKKTNVDATVALAKASLLTSVKKFIFLSTVGVYGNSGTDISENVEPQPNGDYAQTKLEAEKLLKEIFKDSDVELVILRPPLIYGFEAPGNYRSLENVISKRIPLPLGSISNKRSFLFVQNLSWVISELIKSNKEISGTYNVTDGEVVTTSYFLKSIAHHFSFAMILPFPIFLLKLLGKVTGKSRAISKLTDDLSFSSDKLYEILDKKPLNSMKSALVETYKNN